MKIYELNTFAWTGQSRTVKEFEGCPPGWVRTDKEPPTVQAGWAVLWTGLDWLPSPELPKPSIPVPEQVTRRQGWLALEAAGLLSSIIAWIKTQNGPLGKRIQIEWDTQQDFRRDWPLLLEASAAFGLTSEQLDQLFIDAAKL